MATAQKSAAKAKGQPPAKPAKAAPVATAPASRTLKPHEVVLSSNIQNAVSIEAWGKFAGATDLQGLVVDLSEQTVKVQDGDMRPIEGMLFRQAKTLETMFTALARRAASNDGLKQYQVNLTLALKAQAQCRATLEALAEIKNPRPVAFVKQANISNGPQQVNNGAQADSAMKASRTETFSDKPNELLESTHGNALEFGAKGQASGANPHLETVGAGQRA